MTNQTIEYLRAALDVLGCEHKLLAHNIANVDTPGYVPAHVDFSRSFAAALRRCGVRYKPPAPRGPSGPRLEIGGAEVYLQRPDSVPRNDLNAVDIDYEMAELAKNTLRQTLIMRLVREQFARLKKVTREAR